MTPTKTRVKVCKVCRNKFEQRLPMQKVCGLTCAQSLAFSIRGKAEKVAKVKERKADREKKNKDRPLSYWADKAQAEVNKWIRLRDADLPCISCGRHHQGQWHAGHYLSRGAHPELRFEESNIHKQCSACNNHLGGNIVRYRIGLLAKIGAEQVAWLEGPHALKHYDENDFKAIRETYAAKVRAIEKEQA